MQSQPFSFRVLTVVITAAALSLGMASGPAALPAAAGTAVTAAAALQDPTAPGMVVTVPPARLADSRIAQQLSGPLPPLGSGAVQITGHAGVPASGVDAAVLTVTAVSPQAAGYLTVWPSGSTRTTTSNLNFPAGQTIATTVITPLGPDGDVQIFNGSAGTTDLVVDVSGYTRSGSPAGAGAVITVLPSRLADSRIAQQLSGPLPALGSGAVQITGHAGVPASGVDAAVLTVTAVSPQAAGYLTVWPSGSTRTTTSNLNFPAGQTIATTVITPLGPDGDVQIFNGSAGTTDLVVDVSGYTRSGSPATVARSYPLHTGIVSTTFWVGEIFDPSASDGSQMYSTYDDDWYAHFGGCDGITSTGCHTERRTAGNGYFPTTMTPHENPFYLDLPFDDVNNSSAFTRRAQVIPWAGDPGYAGHAKDRNFSYMKNRWVQISKGGKTCYGQIQDAGPGQYNDATYVFGTTDARPLNRRYNAAGLDVSPALNGCLGYASLDGDSDVVSWRFVEAGAVPSGPWTRLITTSGLNNH